MCTSSTEHHVKQTYVLSLDLQHEVSDATTNVAGALTSSVARLGALLTVSISSNWNYGVSI